MDKDRSTDSESFLGRWSRRKLEARATPADPAEARPVAARSDEATPQRPASDVPPPELPRIEDLTIDSDFRGFFHPTVDEDLRRGALRKLFSDPHFNVMDGLDTYIDDYSKTEPIPPAMLAGLRQAQKIIQWAENREDEPEEGAAEAASAEPVAESEVDWRERALADAAPQVAEQQPEMDWRERAVAAAAAEQQRQTTGAGSGTKTPE
jgi:hypothetical protein